MQRWISGVLWCAMFLPISSAQAQRPISIGLGGGVSIPTGDLRDDGEVGWHALGTLALSTLTQPLGLRLDVAYNYFAFTDEAEATLGESGNQTVGSATLNVTYRLPMTDSPLSPYVISGLGAYRTDCSLSSGCDGTTRYGWNVGLGTKLYVLGVRTFLEARYHRTDRDDRDVHFLPVTFGLTF